MDDDAREAAIKRLKAKRDFWTHVATYLIVNAMLVGIWVLTGAGYFWPIWSIGAWGVGLAFHAWNTFGEKPITEEQIQREMRKRDGSDQPFDD